MRVERHEILRQHRHLPSIHSDLTIGSRGVSPLAYGRHESGSKLNIAPLSPYIAELKRTRLNLDGRRQSPNSQFRIRDYLNKARDHSQPHSTINDPRSLATIYLARHKMDEEDYSNTTPTATIQQQPLSTLNRERDRENNKSKPFRRTKYFMSGHQSPSAPLVNPDNLRKIAYTMNTNKSPNRSIETPVSPSLKNSTVPRKTFRGGKYVISSDEIKQTTAAASTSANNDLQYENLMDYVDQEADLLVPVPSNKPSVKVLAEEWPEKIRSVSQIESTSVLYAVEVCRLGSTHHLSHMNADESTEKQDYVSELPEPQSNNRRTKVAAYCLDFTFDQSVKQERRLNWSQLL